MGNCATAPMVQINDDNYEDLTVERLDAVLDALADGETPKAGTQEPGRHTSRAARRADHAEGDGQAKTTITGGSGDGAS